MADKRKSIEDIEEKIKRLEREKDEIQRKNRESQQLEKLKALEETVTASKSSAKSSSNLRSENVRESGTSPVGNRSLSQSNTLDNDQTSDDEYDDDEEMTPQHKKVILDNRDLLVENIVADDIFSELIAKRVLSVSDVNRIKVKNSAEAKNEELLNVLGKRSDRAFYVFVEALRKTLQSWLAKKLDPLSSKSKTGRKRKNGELRVNVDCESIVPSDPKKMRCTCQEVEERMLDIAKNAYFNIRRRDSTPAAYEQFKKELEGTNKLIMEATEVTNMIKMICRHGQLTNISDGSVCFTIRCTSLAACEQLWETFNSGIMLQVFQLGFCTPSFLKLCGAKSIKLCTRVSHFEYLCCAIELAQEELNRLSHSPFKMCLRHKRKRTNNYKNIIRMPKQKSKKLQPKPSCLLVNDVNKNSLKNYKRLPLSSILAINDASAPDSINFNINSHKELIHENKSKLISDHGQQQLCQGGNKENLLTSMRLNHYNLRIRH